MLEALRQFDLTANWPAFAGLAVMVGLILGIVLTRSGRTALLSERDHLRRQLSRLEGQSREHTSAMSQMRTEFGAVGNLALSLAPVVRDLNRNDLEKSDAPRLILRLAKGLFDPRQILLYAVRQVRGAHGPVRELRLITYHGYDKVPDALVNVALGSGKIGWVANHEIDRLAEDWERARATGEAHVPDNHPSLRADLIGPLLHHSNDGQALLGVLCIGEAKKMPIDPKLMFQLVTNFGSLALVTASNMTTLRDRAHHDGLTQLLNKRCFLEDRARNLLVECVRHGRPYSIFMFDIDNFKHYNDHNGHPAGDKLLREMAQLIRDHLRPGDIACRYGGEEFVIAMPNTDRETARELADEFRRKVTEQAFEHCAGQPLGMVSISGGVAASPRDGGQLSDLIKFADEALYDGKRKGRNHVKLYAGVQIGDEETLEHLAQGAIPVLAADRLDRLAER